MKRALFAVPLAAAGLLAGCAQRPPVYVDTTSFAGALDTHPPRNEVMLVSSNTLASCKGFAVVPNAAAASAAFPVECSDGRHGTAHVSWKGGQAGVMPTASGLMTLTDGSRYPVVFYVPAPIAAAPARAGG